MTASLHKLTAGDGYTYLTRQVAAHDATTRGRSPLVDYYLEKGERPGVWMGRGVASLGGRIRVGDGVSEAQMKALFGQGLHPDAERIMAESTAAGVSPAKALRAAKLGYKYPEYSGEPSRFIVELGRAYQDFNRATGEAWNVPISAEVRAEIRTRVARQVFAEQYGRAPIDDRELSGFVARASRPEVKAVAGFDQTFSPVKSVSALWAVAGRGVAEEIEQAHQAAIAAAVRWIEDEVAFTRRGAGGVRQVEVTGLIATSFTHRDSRAGDPDLHTHVAISNKVQAVEDGAWRALDGAVLYQSEVAISERYNTALEAELVARLGVVFEDRPSPDGGRPIREIAGVDTDLLAMWSKRRRNIEGRRAELAAEFQARHGRAPTPKESIELAQQANLETRQAKHEPRAEADQRQAWAGEAVTLLGSTEAVQQMIDSALAPTAARRAAVPTVNELAGQVLDRVASDRARFADTHLMAEALRRVRGLGLAPGRAEQLAAEVTAASLAHAGTVDLSVPDPIADPEVLRRSDGRSVYERAHSRLYTTVATLQAEESILTAARRQDGRRLTAEQLTQQSGVTLNRGQAAMVQEISTSAARVQLVLAPAGSGKTTAMGAFAKAWEASGGSLLGLAPSAVAASELAGATGMHADTMAALLTALSSGSEQARTAWEQRVGPATMVVVDEAGMASTQDLAAVISFALGRGASVRLVGDNQQLASVQAGGVLRDLATEVGAVSLSELMRFADPAEAAATLAVRDGERSALGFYLDRQRVHVADSGSLAQQVVQAWVADRQQGRDSLMLASTSKAVTELNAMARIHRLGDTEEGPRVILRSGLYASAGDVILTRRNDRRNRTSSTDWVKNGDRWLVQAVDADGALQVIHLGSGKRARLDQDYVAGQVDLGYASTIHSAQGVTTDTTHTLLSGLESRQLLYVAASRGRVTNHLYLSTSGDGEEHNVLHPEHVSPLSATDVLERVLDRDGSQRSARTEQREANAAASRLAKAAAVYADALDVAIASVLGAAYMTKLDSDAEDVMPGITSSAAWDALKARLARLALTPPGEPITALRVAADSRELASSGDAAAVLHWRLGAMAGDNDGPLPWLPGLPPGLSTHPQWSAYLALRADRVSSLASQVRQESLALDEADLPAWAHTIDTDRRLVAEVAVWRAARDIPDTDDTVLGPPRVDTLLAQHSADRLSRRVDGCQHQAAPSSLSELLGELEPRLSDDPWLPVLLRRLGVAERAGVDVEKLLREALTAPLPDDHPAAATWFRLTGTLAPTAALSGADTRLRPDWTVSMVSLLPEGVGQRIIRDHQWPTLVAAVEAARDAGADPTTVLASAAALLGLTRPDCPVPSSEWAITLAWRVNDLATHRDAAPPDGDDDAPPPEDEAAPDAEVEALLVEWARQQAERTPQPAEASHEPSREDDPRDTSGEDLHDTSRAADLDASPHGQHDALPATTPVARIVELNGTAAAFYRDHYTGGPAAYVASRFGGDDLSNDPTITIGYAPSGWAALTHHLRSQGATDAELVDAGLSMYSRRGELVDVFRDRVLVGIHDNDGRLVGFSGRAAPGAEPGVPKYLNTRTTDAFIKGAVLFGLPEHRELIEAGAVPARVEGWFDAIAVTKAGGGHVVGCAPLGTALTAAQAQMIAEAAGAGGLVLYAADNDRAGQAAAARDYLALTLEGADPRRLVLIDFADAGAELKDPAEAYQRDAGVSLGRTLAAPHLAPGLVDQLITQRIAQDAERIGRSEASPVVAAARDAGRLIAALPPDQWDTHISVAADVLSATGSMHDHQSLVARETIEAAMAMEPMPVSATTSVTPHATIQSPPSVQHANPERIHDLARRLAALNAEGPAARAAHERAVTGPTATDDEMAHAHPEVPGL